jgi:hypothetical protein
VIGLYRGQVYTVIAIVFGLIALASFWLVMQNDAGMNEIGWFLVMCTGCFASIIALTFAAFAYAMWVPKWERDEKRLGKVLGDERKK